MIAETFTALEHSLILWPALVLTDTLQIPELAQGSAGHIKGKR